MGRPECTHAKRALLGLVPGWPERSQPLGGCSFQATTDAEQGVLIQHPGYRDARVPAWRVTTQEPADLHAPPDGMDSSLVLGSWQFF